MKYESLCANTSIPGDYSSCLCSQVKGEMHGHKQHCSLKRHSRGVVLENLRLIFKKTSLTLRRTCWAYEWRSERRRVGWGKRWMTAQIQDRWFNEELAGCKGRKPIRRQNRNMGKDGWLMDAVGLRQRFTVGVTQRGGQRKFEYK